MKKESKFLKIWVRTITYVTVITTLVLFIEPLSAGYIRDGIDNNNGHPQRMIQVIMGRTSSSEVGNRVDNHPDDEARSVKCKLTDRNIVREHMKNLQPPISGETHIEFWISKDSDSQFDHSQRALFGAAGSQENAYIYAINNRAHAEPIVPANITFNLRIKR